MGLQALRNMIAHGELIGMGILIVIGFALIVLTPAKEAPDRISAVTVPLK